MNFFEHQHKARRKTWLLVGYFLVAVVLIVVAVNAAVYLILQFSFSERRGPSPFSMPPEQWLHSPYWIWISGAVLVVIAAGTLVSYFKTAGGGQAIAARVGARLVDRASRDPRERVLINVVEEMSIASGTPAPLLYILDDEHASNAFAAGD